MPIIVLLSGVFAVPIFRSCRRVGLAVALELFTAVMIRDNLSLNVINLVAPSGWAPIRAIHDWQAGARLTPPPTASP